MYKKHTPNCTFLIIKKLSFNKTQYQTGFTYCGLSQKYQFELENLVVHLEFIYTIFKWGKGCLGGCIITWVEENLLLLFSNEGERLLSALYSLIVLSRSRVGLILQSYSGHSA